MKTERFRVLGNEVARQVRVETGLDELGFRAVVSADSSLRVHGLLVKGGEMTVYTLSPEAVEQLLKLPEAQARAMLKGNLEQIARRFLKGTRPLSGGRD
jgi:hypothetical protein